MEYIFIDNETGEEFSVIADSRKEARIIAKEYFKAPVFQREAPSWEVEAMGIDTY